MARAAAPAAFGRRDSSAMEIPPIFRFLIRMGLALALVTGLARSAEAHAVLVSADPADRAVLDHPPSQVRLTFDEAVALTQLTLVAADGASFPIEGAVTDANVTGTISETLASGMYTLSYRVVSADGHVVGGAIQFGVGAVSGGWKAPDRSGIATQRWILAVLDWLAILSGFLCFGLPLPWRRGVPGYRQPGYHRPGYRQLGYRQLGYRRWGDALAILSAATAIAAIEVQGVAMQGGGILAGLADFGSWQAGADSPALRFAALVAAAVILQRLAVRIAGHGNRLAQYLAAALMVAALATTGHVHTLGWIPSLVLAIHVAGALFWVSALPSLLARLAEPDPDKALRRFSLSALPIVALLIVFGVVLAWLQVLRPIELAASGYGNVLVAKIALVGVLLTLGALNRWKLTPAVALGNARALRWTRISIRTEIALLAVVLALTAALGELTPPRHLLAAGARHAIVDRMIMDRAAMAMATVFANPAGDYDFQVWFSDDAHQPIPVRKVTAELDNPAAGIGPIRRDPIAGSDGIYRLNGLALAPRGNWRLTIKADLSDFDRRIFVLDVKN